MPVNGSSSLALRIMLTSMGLHCPHFRRTIPLWDRSHWTLKVRVASHPTTFLRIRCLGFADAAQSGSFCPPPTPTMRGPYR